MKQKNEMEDVIEISETVSVKDLKERLSNIFTQLGFTTQSEISKILGVGQSQISAYLNTSNENKKPTLTAMMQLLGSYPEISAEYLLRGKGEALLTGNSCTDEIVPEKEVLLVPAGARGGSLDHFKNQVGFNAYNSEVIKTPFINADIAATVKDDHMAPDYPAGTVLCLKKQVIDVIEWGQCYYLDTVDGSKFYMLQPSAKGDSFITCVSLNPNNRYKPFDLDIKYVTALYKIVGSIKW